MKNNLKNKKSIQNWWLIKNIYEDGIIELKNNEIIKIIKIEPISFNLKSENEKESILCLFKNFLISCDFNIQILIHTKKQDLSKYILNIQENLNQEKNSKLAKLAKDYVIFLKKINSTKKLANRDYYLIIKNKIQISKEKNLNLAKQEINEKFYIIKEMLSRVGNICEEVNKKSLIIELINEILNKR